ncbi:hypothetical protein AB4114_29785 [Paenibacillus sp. 2RAB27]|uniref:hypothetical protein n=1 Tax=Paenibacillus sp. 2RAB27 TaxID=3232991 RepID=UPI003F953200
MGKTLLSEEMAEQIERRVRNVWDINKAYWYPLFNCKRNDVIAFDSEYIHISARLKLLKEIFKEHRIETAYELKEDGSFFLISDFFEYEMWDKEPYFEVSECYWFDNNMDWIIYVSHEGTTTFGGEWLRSKIKEKWNDWRNHISWDIKNQDSLR